LIEEVVEGGHVDHHWLTFLSSLGNEDNSYKTEKGVSE